MKELLEYLARGLVEHPDDVRVNEVEEDDGAIVLDEERIRDWLSRGAQPSETVRKLLRTQGIS